MAGSRPGQRQGERPIDLAQKTYRQIRVFLSCLLLMLRHSHRLAFTILRGTRQRATASKTSRQPAERKLAATSTHLLEQGCDIRTVQRLMGHNYVAPLSESRPKLVVRHRVTKPSVSWFQSSLQEPGPQSNIVSINPIRAWLPLRIKSEFLTNVSITQQACSYVLTARYVCRVTPDVGSIYRFLSGPLVRIII
jgi:hypothetical protein